MVDLRRLTPQFFLFLFTLSLLTPACAQKEEPKPVVEAMAQAPVPLAPAPQAPPAPVPVPQILQPPSAPAPQAAVSATIPVASAPLPPAPAPQPADPAVATAPQIPPPAPAPQALVSGAIPVAPAPVASVPQPPVPQAPVTGAVPPPPPAPPAPAVAGLVLAKADGETPGVRLDVSEMKRGSGGTVMLKFSIVNDSDKAMDFGYNFGAKEFDIADFNSIGGVHLIDNAGKKKYLVVRDTSNSCVCSKGLKDLAPKSSVNLWAKFPAPPETVEKISIVVPHFSPLDDVPLSR